MKLGQTLCQFRHSSAEPLEGWSALDSAHSGQAAPVWRDNKEASDGRLAPPSLSLQQGPWRKEVRAADGHFEPTWHHHRHCFVATSIGARLDCSGLGLPAPEHTLLVDHDVKQREPVNVDMRVYV